jgi:aminoglycoside 3'-phosphotransferase-2
LANFEAFRALPAAWRAQLAARDIVPVTTGMTDAHVYRIAGGEAGDRYLKIAVGAEAAHLKQEVERTQWLASVGIRVPKIAERFAGANVFAFMMTAVKGKPAEDAIAPDHGTRTVAAIAGALAALHRLPAAACPFDERLRVRLARARDLVQRGMIDTSAFDARNLGMTAEQLYGRLRANIPADEDCVVTHGDATLDNMIVGDDGKIGLVDCGNAGAADRYVDLALIVGELAERLGEDVRAVFVQAYGKLAWDARKAAFYSDLYELF